MHHKQTYLSSNTRLEDIKRDKAIHNTLEKNRRAHLKECFERLQNELPQYKDKKVTNLLILNYTLKYVEQSKRKERENEFDKQHQIYITNNLYNLYKPKSILQLNQPAFLPQAFLKSANINGSQQHGSAMTTTTTTTTTNPSSSQTLIARDLLNKNILNAATTTLQQQQQQQQQRPRPLDAAGGLGNHHQFRLGRYPINFHMNGNMPSSYVKVCVIHESFNRATNIHASNYLTIEANVIYNIRGGAYFLEDGIEIGNVFKNNLAVFVIASQSLINEDVTPGNIYIYIYIKPSLF